MAEESLPQNKSLPWDTARIERWLAWIRNELEPPISASPQVCHVLSEFRSALHELLSQREKVEKESEELRLLRDWEAARLRRDLESEKCPGISCSPDLVDARLQHSSAWRALRTFRARQQGAA